ncbi:MAG TPA: aminoacetone oxidase family FAD-binding enzyme [Clostridiaceae bacterium]|nr:aminoacetone oxidase family FAD-binding enzyme [Clostridiaceae bacterium]
MDTNHHAIHELDLLIVGGGASGALAALGAVYGCGFNGSIMIVEKESLPLRKLLASGNGRCNLANMSGFEGHYHGTNPSFVEGVLRRLPATELLELFGRWGLITRVDHANRVYPRSMQAKSVSLILLRALARCGLSVQTDTEVLSVEQVENGFRVALSDGTAVKAQAVVIAAGSPASPNLGGSSSGLSILKLLGHTVLEPLPALVPLNLTKSDVMKGAEGVRFRGSAIFESYDGETSPPVSGEFLITSYGLSGIASMELARYVSKAQERRDLWSRKQNDGLGKIVIDFLPEIGLKELESHLKSSAYAFSVDEVRSHVLYDSRRLRTEQLVSSAKTEEDVTDLNILLAGVVPEKIGRIILSSIKCESIHKQQIFTRIANTLKKFELKVEGTRGFEFAQVATGGAVTDEFDAVTLMSENIPGLFACGEILDVDGDTGGYNLLWAFSSGYQAGISAGRYVTGG